MTDGEEIVRDWLIAHLRPSSPGDVIRIRLAADRLADFRYAMSMVTPVRMTEWFDWDRLRVNVAHLVSPRIVRFE